MAIPELLFVDCAASSCLNLFRFLPETTMLGGYLLAVVLLPLAAAQGTQWQSTTCASGAYAANSTYQTNLGLLAAALPANVSASPAGFATATVGVVPDLISALALCRGDANASSCRACVAAGFPGAQRGCPNSKDVAIYQDDCVLRFSDQRFLDFIGVESPAGTYSSDEENLTAPAAWFNAAALALLNATVDQAVAARGDPAKKYFATGEGSFDATYYPKIYGLAQCVPEMTAAQCRGCLGGFIGAAPWFLFQNGKSGGRALGVWCNLRYGVNPFYTGGAMVKLSAPPAPAPAAVPSIATAETPAGRKGRVAGISTGAACFAVLMLILAVFAFIRFKRRKAKKHDDSFNKMARGKCTIYDFPTLQEATGNFSEKHKLGEGGFGTVYKGNLPDGQEIAVKKLIDGAGAGHGLDQIRNEVLVLAQLQHKNLVRLLGFCWHQKEMLLVYEYIKNGSLDNFLFDVGAQEPDDTVDDDSYYTGGAYYYVQAADDDQE
ncbi:hypothetical protein VPH35_028426 [Triticum aestivum]